MNNICVEISKKNDCTYHSPFQQRNCPLFQMAEGLLVLQMNYHLLRFAVDPLNLMRHCHVLHMVVDPSLPPKAYLHLCHWIDQKNPATWTEGGMDNNNESSCWHSFRMECHERQPFYCFCVNIASMGHRIEINWSGQDYQNLLPFDPRQGNVSFDLEHSQGNTLASPRWPSVILGIYKNHQWDRVHEQQH